jgi:hypothetical protein
MNVEKLRQVIKNTGGYRKENTKNIICVCPYCGDHPDPHKKGHMYVSTNPEYPVVHCFYCNKAYSLPKFITDITSSKQVVQEIISREELDHASKRQKTYSAPSKLNTKVFKIPEIGQNSFQSKHKYIRNRSNQQHEAQDFDNLVFDFITFFHENNLTELMEQQIGPAGIRGLQESMVGFLTKNHSMLTCRNIDHNSSFKFRKLVLQQPWRRPRVRLGDISRRGI